MKKRKKYEKLNNYEIVNKFKRVELVTDDGLKTMTSKDALYETQDLGLDLVMMSNKGRKCICKMMDYNKYLYEQKKKEKEAKKKSKNNEVKEIRLGLDISKNDMQHKAKKAAQFLEDGSSLKVSLRIKGRRNMIRKGEGGSKIKEFVSLLGDEYNLTLKFIAKPKLQGRNWSSMIEIEK